MSRFKRLKEIKDRIKVTACGLSLALAIGSAQGLGTYALFTDTENISSEISLSAGDVDVELSDKYDNTNSEFTGNTYNKQLKITNNGTLKQNIKLSIGMKLGEGLTDDDWIESYNIQFDSNIESINNLSYGTDRYLKDTTTNDLFILNPGETITANIYIKTKNKQLTENQKKQLANKSFDLNLNVKAMQIGHENIIGDGFYDIEVRTDKFTIAPMIFGITFKDDGTTQEYITINFENFVETPKNVTLEKKSGRFNDDRNMTWSLSNNSLNIRPDVYNTHQKKWYIDDTFTDKHYLIFAFEYERETRYFKFEFKKGTNSTDRNPSVDVKITEVDSNSKALSEAEIVKSLNE